MTPPQHGPVPERSREAPDAAVNIEAEGAPSPEAPGTVRVGHLTCRARPTSLPFLDGAFDTAALSCPHTWLERETIERALREIERVVRPDGGYAVRISGGLSRRDRARALRALRRAGIEGAAVETSGDALLVRGRRLAGISRETWGELAGGAGATAWNDSMFEFKQTPYDRTTIAGRIFLRRVHWIARRVPAGKRVLEVGCEAGGLLRHLPPSRVIVGLDLSRAALHAARASTPRRDVSLVHADATAPLPFPEASFDAVIASEVLEHCRSPHRVIASMHAVLRPDGVAIISVPNERRYLRWKGWLRRIPLARLALRGIEEGPAAWHIHHDFDRRKLAALIDGFFLVEREATILGTTLVSVLRKVS